jgi:hypothetical protein
MRSNGDWLDCVQPFGRGLALVLQLYLDDSGPAPQPDSIVVGGFLARPNRWRALEREWIRLEEKHHTGRWHTSKMRRRLNLWGDEGTKKWYRLRCKINVAIERPHVLHMGAGMLSSLWSQSLPELEQRGIVLSSFEFCVTLVLQMAASVADKTDETVHVLIEQPATGKEERLWSTLGSLTTTAPWRHRITGRRIGNRDEDVGLRVADYGAHGTYRYLRDVIIGEKKDVPGTDPFARSILSGRLKSKAKYFGTTEQMRRVLYDIDHGIVVGQIPCIN